MDYNNMPINSNSNLPSMLRDEQISKNLLCLSSFVLSLCVNSGIKQSYIHNTPSKAVKQLMR